MFLIANDKPLLHYNYIQRQKLHIYLTISSNNIFSDSLNSESLISNFSEFALRMKKQVWVDAQQHQKRKDHFSPNLNHKFLIVPSFSLVQYQGKLMVQSWKNDKKPKFWIDFGPCAPNLSPQFFLRVILLLIIRHCFMLSSYTIWRRTNAPNLRKWPKA